MVTKKCPTMYAFNTAAHLVAIRCGSWYCPDCMKVNARHWAWRVRLHITVTGTTAWFWTLTMGRKYKTAEQAFEALPGLWDRFRKYIARNHAGKWQYVAFVEGQPERGFMPHFHIISLIKSPKRLKDLAVWSGFGHQAYEKKVTSDKAAYYVAKYASKQSDVTPRNFRRVRASQGWTKLPEKTGPELIVMAQHEPISDYLLRVANETGMPLDAIAKAWLKKDRAEDIWADDDD